jgi:hypothetical protein
LPKRPKVEEATLNEIAKRLDVIIAVLLEVAEKGGKTIPVRTRVRMLSQVGMRPTEVSKILGKSLSYVRKEQSLLRRERGGHPRE